MENILELSLLLSLLFLLLLSFKFGTKESNKF